MTKKTSIISDDCRNELKCIGLRIAYFRKLKNITQADLAEQLSVNKTYLSHIEEMKSLNSELDKIMYQTDNLD